MPFSKVISKFNRRVKYVITFAGGSLRLGEYPPIERAAICVWSVAEKSKLRKCALSTILTNSERDFLGSLGAVRQNPFFSFPRWLNLAIYSANMKGFSRGKGQSAVAGAAYRACERIEEQETGNVYDYTRKQGLLHEAIITPANLNVPDWTQQRSELWNKIHEVETATNARLAREIRIALPHELNDEQRVELAGDYAQWVADRHQVVCDFVIHSPDKNGDERNYHMHMMMTTKQITEDGFRKTKSVTTNGRTVRFIPLDDKKLGGAEVKAMREQVAHCMNDALEKAGSDARVDHRSYVEQELDIIPMIHLGKEATNLERQGIETELGEKNRRIEDFNFINSVLPAGYALPSTANENHFKPLLPDRLVLPQEAPEPTKELPLFPMPAETTANVPVMRWEEQEEEEQKQHETDHESHGLFDNLKQHLHSMMDWATEHAQALRENWQLMEEEQEQQQQAEQQRHHQGFGLGFDDEQSYNHEPSQGQSL